jgi:hypothetical protein
MRLGSCSACEAKDADIAFLRSQVEKLQDRALGMADPLLQARLAQAARIGAPRDPEPQQPPATPRTGSLQKLRRHLAAGLRRPDADEGMPIPRTPKPEDAEAVEASFEAR